MDVNSWRCHHNMTVGFVKMWDRDLLQSMAIWMGNMRINYPIWGVSPSFSDNLDHELGDTRHFFHPIFPAPWLIHVKIFLRFMEGIEPLPTRWNGQLTRVESLCSLRGTPGCAAIANRRSIVGWCRVYSCLHLVAMMVYYWVFHIRCLFAASALEL